MTRKLVSALFLSLLVIVLVLAGCASTPTTQPPTTSATPTSSAPVTTTQPSTSAPAPTTSATPSSTATTGDTIKIGHIRVLTGSQAGESSYMVQAFDLAFKQMNYTVAGKKIEIIQGDSQASPQTAVQIAQRMVNNDKVSMVIGSTPAGEIAALAAYLDSVHVPELISNQVDYNMLTQYKWLFAIAGTYQQLCSTTAVYLYDQLGYRNVSVLAWDNTGGHTVQNAFMSAFKAKGGNIVQEIFVPYPTSDYTPFLATMKKTDAMVAWVSGADAIKFLTAYHDMGIDKNTPLVGAYHGAFLAPFTLDKLPPAAGDATVGDIFCTIYSPLINTPENTAFINLEKPIINKFPDDTEASPYQVGQIVINAIKALNGDVSNSDKLKAALINATKNTTGPMGKFNFDESSMSSIISPFMVKITKQDNQFLWEPVFNYGPVPPAGQSITPAAK
jgi:branched-chain amino acid transport system substrate-binding protein